MFYPTLHANLQPEKKNINKQEKNTEVNMKHTINYLNYTKLTRA